MLPTKVFDFLQTSGIGVTYAENMGCTFVSSDEVAAASGFPIDKIGPEGAIKIPYKGVRAHDGSEFCRYRLLAKDAEPKYLGLSGHASEIYIPVNYEANKNQDTLYIPEGEKKAALLDSLGLRALGIPGVSAWLDHGHRAAAKLQGEGLTEDTIPHKVLLREAATARNVVIVGDSDLHFKPEAAHSLKTFKAALQKSLDIRAKLMINDPSVDLINTPRNTWVSLAILPPTFEVIKEDGTTKIERGKKAGVDDLYVSIFNMYLASEGHEAAALKAAAILRRNVGALAIANLGRSDNHLSLIVANANQTNLAHAAGTFRCYQPGQGIWCDAKSGEELGAVPAISGQYATASSTLATIRHKAMLPLGGIPNDARPAFVTEWEKEIKQSIKDLARAENDLNSTNSQIAILRQVSRRVMIPDQRWDSHPDLFAVANGVINLRTGEFFPHSPDRLLTVASPAFYDPTADCKEFEDFIARVLPDPATRSFVQATTGYSLTGHTDLQRVTFYQGPGGNGKGAFTNVIRDTIHGEYAIVADKSIIVKSRNGVEAHPTNIAALRGKRWATFSELDEHSQIDCGALKSITGDDMKTGRKMRQDFFDFRPQATYTIDTNEVPYLSDTGPSMRRRLVMVPWNFSVGENPDQKLPARLRLEASGILNWCLAGARAYYAGALHPSQMPDEVREATAKLWGSLDITQQWIDSECIKDPTAETNAKVLFSVHREWREASLNPQVSANMFGRKMRQAGFSSRESNGQKLFQGIRLRNSSESAALGYDHVDESDVFEEPAPKKPVGSETSTAPKKRRFIQ